MKMSNEIEFSNYPFYTVICITSKCNANCIHCSSASNNDTTEDMSTTKILEVLQELNDCGVFQIGISGGEPLLHPDFDLIAKKAVSLGFIVGVGTNGSTINEDTIRKIKEIGIHRVQVSLDGSNSATHDSFRRTPGLFNLAINAIKMMIREHITVNVCMTPTKLNYKELDELIDMCIQLGVSGFNLSQFVPVGRGSKELDLSPDQWKKILTLWNEKRKKYENVMNFTSHEAQLILVENSLKNMKAFQGCQAGKGVCCIKTDGTVLPCVMLDVPVGNIKYNSFKEIWTKSKILQSIRDRTRYDSPCAECKYLYKCGGCRGVAYGLTGDYLSSDGRCWYNGNEN